MHTFHAPGYRRSAGRWVLAALLVASLHRSSPAAADVPPASDTNDGTSSPLRVGVELDTNFRHSENYVFPFHYPGLSGRAAQQQTVDPGSHFEVSDVSLLADYQPSPLFSAHLRFNGVNRYYRNPTSGDKPYDLAELWLRWGREAAVALEPQLLGAYIKFGKFDRPEKPLERPLVSYGLLDTAFNLFADAGLEAGGDLGKHFFVKTSVTQGNPLFIRDPNALAGDTPEILTGESAALNSGSTILYDSHVERFDFSHPEYAGYLGWRTSDEGGSSGAEVLAWGRRRTLETSADLPGSPLGADLAALVGPNGTPLLPIHGNGKQEMGANIWLFRGGQSIFAQYVYQRVAGLSREGVELQGTWRIDLPLTLAAGGHQLFSFVAPSLRYSRLHDDFPNVFPTAEPSLAWDWEKWDGGVRLGIWHDIDLTVEYSYNRIYVNPRFVESENEGLATLRIRVW